MPPAGQIARELADSCNMRAIAGCLPPCNTLLLKSLRISALHANNCTGETFTAKGSAL